MLKIDNTLLVDVGLGSLPEAEKNSFLKHIYETLEMRVGIRLADQMSNQQLDEFERYFEAKDDAGAFKWLETNFPNYKDIVQEEFDKLKAEVAQSAPQILAASQQAGVAPQQPQPMTAENNLLQTQAAPMQAAAPAPAQPYAAPGQAAVVEQPQPFQQTPAHPGQPANQNQQPQYPGQQPPVGPAQTS